MTYRDPELDALIASMADHAKLCDECGMGHWARPMNRAIALLKKEHPYFEKEGQSDGKRSS